MAVDINHVGLDLDFGFSEDFDVREDQIEALRTRIQSAPIDVGPALETYTALSDQYQSKVIAATGKTIRLVAPAGSGKTQTMINRVLTRMRDGVLPRRIVMLTFDRSAAGSLESKLSESVADIERTSGKFVPINELTITTLNAFGYRLLNELSKDQYLPMVKPSHRFKIMRECLQDLEARSRERYDLLPRNLKFQYYLEVFSYLKNQVQDPRNLNTQEVANLLLTSPQTNAFFDDFDGETLNPDQVKLTIQAVMYMYQKFDQIMVRDRVMDFDDQKLRAYVLLRDKPDLLARIQNRYDEVIVDEFQDINRLDFELIKLIAAKSTLIVTGDDDQAIYGFRGCTPDYIIDLEHHLGRPTESHELSINYRSPANIVEHADKLIRHNSRRIAKSPRAYQQHRSTISVVPTLSASLEAKTIAEFISTTHARSEKVDFKDIAVLYRTNAQSLPIQIELLLSEIPYHVREEDNILQNDSFARLMSLLRAKLAISSGRSVDAVDQVNVIKSYFQYIDKRSSDALLRLALSGIMLLDFTNPEPLFRALPKAANSNFLDAFHELVAARNLDAELDVLRKKFNRGLQGMVGSLEDAVDQKAPLAEIFDMARDYNGETAKFLQTLEGALSQGRQVNAGHNRDGVSLLTYFKSKGRQWHTVILTSCNEGLIPHARAPIEDERRLFYVALTRASSNLLISYVENAVDNKVKPSRFLTEAGLLRLNPRK